MADPKCYEGWAILELMGHRRLGGMVSQAEQYGVVMLRIDIPGEGGATATQFYGGSSIYCLTPTTEELARAVAMRNQPAPKKPVCVEPSPFGVREQNEDYEEMSELQRDETERDDY